MKWEYKTVKVSTGRKTFVGKGVVDEVRLDAVLNQLGNEGWELISLLSSNYGFGATYEVVATFKRQKT